jgi:serine/threonine protein kinase
MTTDTGWTELCLCNGRYQVAQRLGAGGMAVVYRARDLRLGCDVVIKTPQAHLLADADFAARFAREVRSLVHLAHPAVVRVLDVGEHDGVPFAILDYLPGGSLRDRQVPRLGGRYHEQPPPTLHDWLERVALALDHIHGQGFLHRDVKPDNILFDRHGNAYLGDFGIAKAVGDARTTQGMPVQTGTGVVIGTPSYIAPERLLAEPCDGRADQFALAVTVYEWLSGELPHDGPTPAFVIVKLTTRPPTPLTEVVPTISASLAAVVHRALARHPEERYPNCLSFAGAVLGEVTQSVLVPTTRCAPAVWLPAPPSPETGVTLLDQKEHKAQAAPTSSAGSTRAPGTQPLEPETDRQGFQRPADAVPSTPPQPGRRPLWARTRLLLALGGLVLLAATAVVAILHVSKVSEEPRPDPRQELLERVRHEVKPRASRTSKRYPTQDGRMLPLYSVWLEGPPEVMAEIHKVLYHYDSNQFVKPRTEAWNPKDGFKDSYLGIGSLDRDMDIIVVLRNGDTVELKFNMYRALTDR